MHEYSPSLNTFPHQHTEDTYFMVFHREREIGLFSAWRLGTFHINSARWSLWKKNLRKYNFVVVASTDDPTRDHEFKEIEYRAGASMSPDIPEILNTPWSRLPHLTVNDLNNLTADYLCDPLDGTTEDYIRHTESMRVFRLLSTLEGMSRPVQLYTALMAYMRGHPSAPVLARELSQRMISMDVSISLADHVMMHESCFEEVMTDIIPAMDHLVIDGEPITELQEALLP